MNNNIIKKFLTCSVFGLMLMSCDSYLDKMPDNRAEIDTEQKVQTLLVSAYPDHGYQLMAEFSSDNVDDLGKDNPNSIRFFDQIYHWIDITEKDNEDTEAFWESSYSCIAAANHAIEACNEIAQETGWTTGLQQAKAEALLCRAYNHFMLLNIFAKNYNSKTAKDDVGITYMTSSEVTLKPQYKRQSVKECYELIEKDIEEALPNIGESYMKVPKYHFNSHAAYAFATRFYLFYEKWDKALAAANHVLGDNPSTILRDYKEMSQMTQETDAITQHYIDSKLSCNFMLTTGYSYIGLVFGPYAFGKRYSHCPYIDNNETASATYPWGATSYYNGIKKYSATNLSADIFWRAVFMFEYTDAVAGIGFYRTVTPEFTADECLLDRAEAEIMLKKYDAACADMTTWLHNIAKNTAVLTPTMVQNFYNGVNYSYDDSKGKRNVEKTSTVKKHLNPAFSIDAEGSVQESMIQCVLGCRRIETLHLGKRWFDIRRWGIEIPRRIMNAAGNPSVITDWLLKDDPRRALQIPLKVRSAGYDPNYRSENKDSKTYHTIDIGEKIPLANIK
jgi:hypothetical protein